MYCFMCVLYCTGCLWRTPSKDRVPGRFCGTDSSKHTWRYGGVIVVAVCVCVCLCWSGVCMLQCPALICRIWAKKWHWSCRAHRRGMQRKKQKPLHKLCELLYHPTVFLCLIVLMDVKSWYFLPHIHHMSFSYGACADFMFFVLLHFLTVDSCCVWCALWTL